MTTTSFDLLKERRRKQKQELLRKLEKQDEQIQQHDKLHKKMLRQIPPAVLQMKEKRFEKISRQRTDKLHKLGQLQNTMQEIQSLVDKYKQQRILTPNERNRLLQLRQHIENQQELIKKLRYDEQYDFKRLREKAMRYFRSHDFFIKFSSDYYNFLKKKMFHTLDTTAFNIIENYPLQPQKGLAYEALWTILISLGFCNQFNRQDYDFYDAELKEETDSSSFYFINEIMTYSKYLQFLKQTPIKGVNGKSDIILRNKKDGTWIFVSCKYYIKEKGNYDIKSIYNSIQKTNEKYPHLIGEQYKIYVFVNNKIEAEKVLVGSTTMKDVVKHDPFFYDKIQTNGKYNIVGMEELETCFKRFRDETLGMSWGEFEKMFIKNYPQLPPLILRLDQIPIVNKTIDVIWENMEKNKCNTRQQNSLQNLQIFWETIPQFGKTYCVGMLLLNYYLKIPPMYKKTTYFNTVIVVDDDNNPEMVKKYTNEVFGGHEQFTDDFHVAVIQNRPKPTKQTSLTEYLRMPPQSKPVKILQKNVDKNNIFIVLKKDLHLVSSIPNLQLIVFDEYDSSSNQQFENFTSLNKIGLFLTSTRRFDTRPECSFLFQWKFDDTKAVEQINKQLDQSPEKQLRDLQHTKSFFKKHEQTYGRTLSVPFQTALRQDLDRCLKNSIDLYILSNYLYVNQTSLQSKLQQKVKTASTPTQSLAQQQKLEYRTLLQQVQKALEIINDRKQDKNTFSTQLWFSSKSQELKQVITTGYDYFNIFDVVVYKEPNIKTNRNRHPAPIADNLPKIISHYQEIALSNQKKGLILLLDATDAIRGVSLPNVDTVFSLDDKLKMDTELYLSYLMMSKCMTPRQGKKSVFFVDFNVDRVFRVLKKYFGDNIENVIQKQLVHLVDVNQPDIPSRQIAQKKAVQMIYTTYRNVLKQIVKKEKPITPSKAVKIQTGSIRISEPTMGKTRKSKKITGNPKVDEILKLITQTGKNKSEMEKRKTPKTINKYRKTYEIGITSLNTKTSQLLSSGASATDIQKIKTKMNQKFGRFWNPEINSWVHQQSKDQSKTI